ncbi:MAG: hypothetical protein Q9221_004237 [Calogaya cf. arnoldii]
MYSLVLIAILLLYTSVLGLPFTQTTTASPAVSQISDGQVQAAAGPRPSTKKSSHAGTGPSTTSKQNSLPSGSSVFTVKTTDSLGSLTTQTTTASNVVITSLLGGQRLVGIPTTNSEGHLILTTSTLYLEKGADSQPISAGSTATVAGEKTNEQQTLNEVQTTLSDPQTPSTTPAALDPASESIQTAVASTLGSFVPNTASSSSETEPAELISGLSIDAQQTLSSVKQALGNPSKSGSSTHHDATSPAGLQLSTSIGLTTPSGISAPQESGQTPVGSGDILDSHIPSTRPTQSLMNVSDKGPPEAPIIGTASNTPASRLAEATTTTSNPSWVASPSQGGLGVHATRLPAITDAASIDSSFRLGDSITTQIINTQGYPVPAVIVVTTGAGGSTSAKLVSLLQMPSAPTDSAPTSTMTATPPGLSVEQASNSLWTTNTWTTTVPPGGSDATVLPVLVGCPGCGGRGFGLVIWNLPEIPRVQFHFPSIPKLPRFHIPCLRILGIKIGSCSDPSKLPEVITDPPEPGDIEPGKVQGEDEGPDPDDQSKSDDRRPSTTSEISRSTLSSTTVSSSSSSSTSTSSCTSGITLSATTLCGMPTLRGVVDRNIEDNRKVPPPTGTHEPLDITPYATSTATLPTFVPSADTAIFASLGMWASETSTYSATNSMTSTIPPLPSSSPSQTKESPTSTVSTSPQVEDSPSPPDDDSSTPGPTSSQGSALTDGTAPPRGPSCYINTGQHEDSHESAVEDIARDFCDRHKDRIVHADDEAIRTSFGGATEVHYSVGVSWMTTCEKPEGSKIWNPYGGEENMCFDLLKRAWKECNNQGRGGVFYAGCLAYSMDS